MQTAIDDNDFYSDDYDYDDDLDYIYPSRRNSRPMRWRDFEDDTYYYDYEENSFWYADDDTREMLEDDEEYADEATINYWEMAPNYGY